MRSTLLLLAALLAGCASSPRPPITEYSLQPTMAPAAPDRPHDRRGPVLQLAVLEGARPYATRKLLYRRGPQLAAYAWHRWADTPLTLVGQQLREHLARTGRFTAVLPPGSSARGDLLLEGELLDFSLHLGSDGPAQARVTLRLRLLNPRQRQVLSSRLFQASEPVPRPSPRSAALALARATRHLARAVAGWVANR